MPTEKLDYEQIVSAMRGGSRERYFTLADTENAGDIDMRLFLDPRLNHLGPFIVTVDGRDVTIS